MRTQYTAESKMYYVTRRTSARSQRSMARTLAWLRLSHSSESLMSEDATLDWVASTYMKGRVVHVCIDRRLDEDSFVG